MNVSFVQPWLAYGDGEKIEIDGIWKSYLELRQQKYEQIIDEMIFIGRASEGAISIDWLERQPISVRTKYVKEFEKELKEREAKLNQKNKGI